MHRLVGIIALLWLSPPASGGERADFDYFLLAISWTPGWCSIEGDARADPRCSEGSGRGWSLHGLWPQFEEGWPEFCTAPFRPPSRAETEAQQPLFGSAGLARHQWNKHGSCSGLAPDDYFALSLAALERVNFPPPPDTEARVHARELEAQFIAANPWLADDGLVVTCRMEHLQEVRICLTRELDGRACGADVRARACSGAQQMAPPR